MASELKNPGKPGVFSRFSNWITAPVRKIKDIRETYRNSVKATDAVIELYVKSAYNSAGHWKYSKEDVENTKADIWKAVKKNAPGIIARNGWTAIKGYLGFGETPKPPAEGEKETFGGTFMNNLKDNLKKDVGIHPATVDFVADTVKDIGGTVVAETEKSLDSLEKKPRPKWGKDSLWNNSWNAAYFIKDSWDAYSKISEAFSGGAKTKPEDEVTSAKPEVNGSEAKPTYMGKVFDAMMLSAKDAAYTHYGKPIANNVSDWAGLTPEQIENLGNKVVELGKKAVNAGVAVAGTVMDLKDKAMWVGQNPMEAVELLGENLKKTGESIMEYAESGLKATKEGLDAALDKGGQLTEQIKDTISSGVEAVKEVTVDITNKSIQTGKSLGDSAFEYYEAAEETIGNLFEGMSNLFSSAEEVMAGPDSSKAGTTEENTEKTTEESIEKTTEKTSEKTPVEAQNGGFAQTLNDVRSGAQEMVVNAVSAAYCGITEYLFSGTSESEGEKTSGTASANTTGKTTENTHVPQKVHPVPEQQSWWGWATGFLYSEPVTTSEPTKMDELDANAKKAPTVNEPYSPIQQTKEKVQEM